MSFRWRCIYTNVDGTLKSLFVSVLTVQWVFVFAHVCMCGFLQTSGYLNLLANCIDNFTHGLAVAGSFLVSRKVS